MAKNVNEKLFDAQIQHAMTVELYNKHLNTRVDEILSKSDVRVRSLISKGNNRGAKTLISQVTLDINNAYDDVLKMMDVELSKFVGSETAFNNELLDKHVGKAFKLNKVKTADVRKAIIGSRIAIGKNSGATFQRHIRTLAAKEVRQVRAGIRQGITRGLSEGEIVDFIYDNPKFTAPNRLARHQMRAVVRTTLTSVQSNAAAEVFLANSDIISNLKYLAVLDKRTSGICRQLDGLIQKNDEFAKRPPQHYGCRSVIIPIVDAYDKTPKSLRKRGIPEASRSAINGTVPGSVNYQQWLAGQGAAVQNAILGSVRAADVFRQGNVSVKDMVNSNGANKSVGAMWVDNNAIIEGKSPSILKQNNSKSAGNIENVIVTNRQAFHKTNIVQIEDLIDVRAKDLQTPFGNMSINRTVIDDFFDADTNSTITNSGSFLQWDKKVWLDQLERSQNAVRDGAITPKELENILKTSERLFAKRVIDINQRTTIVNLLTRQTAQANGYSGKGAGAKAFAKDSSIDLDKVWTSAELKKQLDLATGQVLGRYGKIKRVLISVDEAFDAATNNEIIRLFKKNARKRSEVLREPLVKYIEDLEITTEGFNINQLAEDIFLLLAKSDGGDLLNVGQKLGTLFQRHRGITPDVDAYDAIRFSQIRDFTQIGVDLVQAFEGLIPTRVVVRSRGYLNGKATATNTLESVPFRGDKGVWVTYARALEAKALVKGFPNTKGKTARVVAGKETDSLGNRVITGKQDTDFDPVPTQADADDLNFENVKEYSLDEDLWNTIKILRDNGDDTMLAGGFFDTKIAEYFPKFRLVYDVVERQIGKPISYSHHFDYRHRIYPRGYPISYNGTPWEKILHQNYKASKIVNAEADFAQFRFSAAEFLGNQKFKVNGRYFEHNIDYAPHRADIFEHFEDRMLKLGEAMLTGNRADIIKYSKFVGQFKKDNRAGIFGYSLEYAKRVRYFKDNGTFEGFETKLRVGQDVTASGPQTLSIIARDAKLGRATNIIPTDKAGNISTGANQLKQSPYKDIFPELQASGIWNRISALKDLTREQADKLFKLPVMTTLYNLSKGIKRVYGTDGKGLKNKDGSPKYEIPTGDLKGLAGQIRVGLADALDLDIDGNELIALLSDKELIDLTIEVSRAIATQFEAFPRANRFVTRLGKALTKEGNLAKIYTPFSKRKVTFALKKRQFYENSYLYNGERFYFTESLYRGVDSKNTGRTFGPFLFHVIDADFAREIRRIAAKEGIKVDTNHDSWYVNSPHYDRLNEIYKDLVVQLEADNYFERIIEQAFRAGDIDLEDYEALKKLLDKLIVGDLGDFQANFRGSTFASS